MELIIKGELTIETESGIKINSKIIEILKLIENTGSLNMAVKQAGISYSHAWNSINQLNCQLENPIILSQRGGKGGGIATVTETGKQLIMLHDQLKKDFNRFLKEHTISLTYS